MALLPRLGQGRPARGQALVEFSLIIVLALVVLMAVVDLGRAVYGISSLSNATRAGGRTAIVNQYLVDVRQRTANQAVALGVDPSAVACSPSPGTATNAPTPTTPSGICVEFRTADLTGPCPTVSLGCVAVVTAKWTYTPITPLIGRIVGPIGLVSTTRMPVESVCTTSGCPIP